MRSSQVFEDRNAVPTFNFSQLSFKKLNGFLYFSFIYNGTGFPRKRSIYLVIVELLDISACLHLDFFEMKFVYKSNMYMVCVDTHKCLKAYEYLLFYL